MTVAPPAHLVEQAVHQHAELLPPTGIGIRFDRDVEVEMVESVPAAI